MEWRLPVLLAMLLAGTAHAYRPFDETDADVAELHVFEIEAGPLQFQRSNGLTSYVPSLILNLGVLPGCEVVVDGLIGTPVSGARPGETTQLEVGVAFKAVLRRGSLQDAEGPSVALEPELLLPSTAGPSAFGFATGLIVSQRWPALTVHFNLVPAWSRAHQASGLAGVIVEGPYDWAVRPVGETYVEAEHGSPSVTGSGLLGLIWRASPGLSFDAALRVATVDGNGLVEVRVGLTWDVRL
jgi:hypothetical protein